MADVAFLCQKKYGGCGIFMPEEIWQMWHFYARRNMADVAFLMPEEILRDIDNSIESLLFRLNTHLNMPSSGKKISTTTLDI
jgi:hypothetical protein